MTNENIFHSMKQMTGFTDTELGIVLKHFETKSIKKKPHILEAGAIAKEVYYILNGCSRLFYEKDGEDISAYIIGHTGFCQGY